MPQKASDLSALQTVVQAVLAAACVAVGGIIYANLATIGSSTGAALQQGDHLSDKERSLREQRFDALPPLQLRRVAAQDMSAALDSMLLSAGSRQALLTATAFEDQPTISASPPRAAASPDPASAAASPSAARDPTSTPQPVQTGQPRLRLAWITLWDTDIQDGDVVRIEAQGYSRTVTLTKRGDTFAIPVPANGIIRMIGVKDGDGGGITVGAASGAVAAVFPIMSPGQTLELRVTMD